MKKSCATNQRGESGISRDIGFNFDDRHAVILALDPDILVRIERPTSALIVEDYVDVLSRVGDSSS